MQRTNTEVTKLEHENYHVEIEKIDEKFQSIDIRYGCPDKDKDNFRLTIKSKSTVKALKDILNYIEKENIF